MSEARDDDSGKVGEGSSVRIRAFTVLARLQHSAVVMWECRHLLWGVN